MKKILVVAVVVAIALMGATAAMANIAGSKHDLTTAGNQTVRATASTISNCQFCHTPHRGDTSVVGAPLWNKSMSAQSYSTYGVAGVTLGGTAVGTPGANSKTCLSCHDGSLSIGNVIVGGNQTITDVANRVTAGILTANNINTIGAGNNLANDHPIGIIVLANPTQAGLDTLANMRLASFKFYGAGLNQMECATCHDPHLTSYTTFLRRNSNVLCSACHINK